MTEEKDKNSESTKNKENLENIQKIKNLLSSDKSDIFEILALKQKITFDNKSEEEQINNDIWEKQYLLIFPPNDSIKSTKPNLSQLNLLITSADKYKIKDNEKIKKVKFLQQQANNYLKEISKLKTMEQLNIYKSNIEKINLDLSEYLIQRETKIKASKEITDISNPTSSKQTTNSTNLFITKDLSSKPKHRKKNYKKKEDSYEADFIHDEEDSENSEIINQMKELNKKEGSSFKRYADGRNINKKRDDDFVYDDDLNEGGIEQEGLGIDIGEEINEINKLNNNKKRKKKENEGDEEYSEDSSLIKKEKKEKMKMLNKKIKRPNEEKKNIKILPLNSNEENKTKSRQKALNSITEILKSRRRFSKSLSLDRFRLSKNFIKYE